MGSQGGGLRSLKKLCLLFLPNVPGATFLPPLRKDFSTGPRQVERSLPLRLFLMSVPVLFCNDAIPQSLWAQAQRYYLKFFIYLYGFYILRDLSVELEVMDYFLMFLFSACLADEELQAEEESIEELRRKAEEERFRAQLEAQQREEERRKEEERR